MPTTLILTRNPLKEFKRYHQSGRFGELIAVKGPKIKAAKLLSMGQAIGAKAAALAKEPRVSQAVTDGIVKSVDVVLSRFQISTQFVPVNTGILELTTEGGAIDHVKRFTTVERFKADSGKGFYVQLHPKPDPYFITFESGNSAVKKLRSGHDGRCFRVHGGKPGPEQGILIHEAPHVGWVIGCIGPRPLHDFSTDGQNVPGNPSAKAMEELFRLVGRERSSFFVLDW